MIIQPNSQLLMIGDSITDCGRDRPIGIAPDGLGDGYVALVNGLVQSTYPQSHIQLTNTGISGNTVRDLKARWQQDVLDLSPDWLSIMIGINDVWRQFDSYEPDSQLISLEEYIHTLEELIRSTQPKLKGLILMTPYYIESNQTDPMRSMMDKYGAALRGLSQRHHTILVDTQAAFDEVLIELQPTALADDGVHPNLAGHFVLARAFLKAINYAW